MSSNPLTPLQKAEHQLRRDIQKLENDVGENNLLLLNDDRKAINRSIEKLIEEAQLAVYKLL